VGRVRLIAIVMVLSMVPAVSFSMPVARGIVYEKYREEFSNGPSDIHVLRVDPNLTDVDVIQARIGPPKRNVLVKIIDTIFFFLRPQPEYTEAFGVRSTSQLVEEGRAVAGVNGTYFASDAAPLGLLAMEREIVSYPLHDRPALLIGKNEVYVGHFFVIGKCIIRGNQYDISEVNQQRTPGQIVLFTPRYGDRTRTVGRGLEVIVRKGVVTKQRYANSPIPKNGFVLSTRGDLGQELAPLTIPGTRVEINFELRSFQPGMRGSFLHAVGGGPELLRAGKKYVTKHEERFRRDISEGHAARTAAGITPTGELLLVVVDGKKRKGGSDHPNNGSTLEELADFLLRLGAEDALNMDGGGSSTMVVRNKVVNNPVEGEERPVSNAIVIRSRPTLAEE